MRGLIYRYKDVGNKKSVFNGLYYREAIEQGLDNLLQTVRGERLFRPDFGSVLDSVIFDPAHEITKYGVITALANTLNQEERIEPIRIDVTLVPDQSMIDVVIEYRIVGTAEAFIYKRKITL